MNWDHFTSEHGWTLLFLLLDGDLPSAGILLPWLLGSQPLPLPYARLLSEPAGKLPVALHGHTAVVLDCDYCSSCAKKYFLLLKLNLFQLNLFLVLSLF